jgi:hypothetical protein
MPTLSLEMMREVTKHLRKKDVCSVALLCKAFCIMAQEVLFRHVTLDTTRWRIYMAFAGGLESQPPRCKRLHLSIHSLHFTMGNSIIRRAWVEMFPVMMHMQYMWRLKSFTWSTNMWTPLVTSDVFCGVMRSHIPDSCKSVLFYVSFGFFFCLRSSRK